MITWNDAALTPVSGNAAVVLPGHFINLTIDVLSPAGATPTDIFWGVEDTAFVSYIVNPDSGILTPLDPNGPDVKGQTIAFYWSDSGTKLVNVFCKINGVDLNLVATMTVIQPQVNFVAFNPASIGLLEVRTLGSDDYFGLADSSASPDDGIYTLCNVPTPRPDLFKVGQWGYAQLVSGAFTRQLDTNPVVCKSRATAAGAPMDLDKSFPYPTMLFNTGDDNNSFADSPKMNVVYNDPPNPSQECTQLRMSLQFKTFLIYKPADNDNTPVGGASSWVTLASFTWGVAGCVQDVDDNWVVQQPNSIMPSAWGDDTTQPTWTQNIDNVTYQNVACPGACPQSPQQVQTRPSPPTPTPRP